MIPETLELTNFLSYRGTEEIDLRPIQLAVIAGKNGHGKSAIVDAMTWAVWREARKGQAARTPDADLLNLSERESDGDANMRVRLVFRSGGARYEIVRKYRETASGKTTESDLQFKNLTAGTDLTAGAQSETQEEIEEAIGMDHDLFCATTLFEQGKWDQLMEATPSERKDMLFELLRLGRFDDLKAGAKERRDNAQDTIDNATAQAEQLREDLEGAEEREETLSAKREQLSELENEAEYYNRCLSIFDEITSRLNSARYEKKSANHTRETAEEKRESALGALKEHKEKLEGLREEREQLFSGRDRDDIQALADRKDDLQSKVRSAEKQKKKADQTRQAIDRITGRIVDAKSHRDQQIERFEEQVSGEEELQQNLESLGAEIGDLKDEASSLAGVDEKLESAKERRDTLSEKLQEMDKKLDRLNREVDQEEEIIAEAQAALGSGDEVRCERCGSVLDEAHAQEIIREADTRADDLIAEINRLGARADETEADLEAAKESVEALQSQKEKLRDIQAEIRNLEGEKERLQESMHDVQTAKKKLQKLREGDLSPIGGPSLPELKADLAEVKENLSDLSYDEERHEKLQEKLEAAREAKNIAAEDRRLQRSIQETKELIQREEEKAEEAEKQVAAAETKIASIQETIGILEQRYDRFSDAETKFNQTRERLQEVRSAVDRLSARVESDQDKQERLEELLQKRDSAEETLETASLLTEAFGRDGIPSMLLEAAIPQIESRANELLDELTGGSFQLRMDTTREKSTGGTADTLGVKVIAEGTERPYEALSGGERFRTSFALRVALSQHLAAQTGRPVQTLVVDEGFGTQDADGLDAVKKTIAQAAESFERVLVITHIQELKDAFPQRIQIEKTPGRGSSATVHA